MLKMEIFSNLIYTFMQINVYMSTLMDKFLKKTGEIVRINREPVPPLFDKHHNYWNNAWRVINIKRVG
jgi:hypothetical protein